MSYYGVLLTGLLGLFWWLKNEIEKDNVISLEMIEKNQEPFVVLGADALEFPWSDSMKNLDPENNGEKRIKKWNFRKVQIKGYFKKKAVLGI